MRGALDGYAKGAKQSYVPGADRLLQAGFGGTSFKTMALTLLIFGGLVSFFVFLIYPHRTRAPASRPAAAALVPATAVDPRMRICHSDFTHRPTHAPL